MKRMINEELIEKVSEMPSAGEVATKTELAKKQDALTAGDNINIKNNVISATGGGKLYRHLILINSSGLNLEEDNLTITRLGSDPTPTNPELIIESIFIDLISRNETPVSSYNELCSHGTEMSAVRDYFPMIPMGNVSFSATIGEKSIETYALITELVMSTSGEDSSLSFKIAVPVDSSLMLISASVDSNTFDTYFEITSDTVKEI